jgi:hypothetical protein
MDFGELDDGHAMYEYLRGLVSQPDSGLLRPGLTRSTGENSGRAKITPLQYILHDRQDFEDFMRYLEENPEYLSRIGGFGLDHIAYDWVQPARALLLNARKGIVKPELYNEYVSLLAKSCDYTLPTFYGV